MRQTEFAATVLRIALGTMWISHALLKLWVFTLPGTVKFFESVGLPGWAAYPVFAAELAGGAAMVLGLYARHVALGLLPIMLVATFVHVPNGWVFTSQGGGWEYPAFLSIALVVQALLGDGKAAMAGSEGLLGRAKA
jgi:putative oxidoreductase